MVKFCKFFIWKLERLVLFGIYWLNINAARLLSSLSSLLSFSAAETFETNRCSLKNAIFASKQQKIVAYFFFCFDTWRIQTSQQSHPIGNYYSICRNFFDIFLFRLILRNFRKLKYEQFIYLFFFFGYRYG